MIFISYTSESLFKQRIIPNFSENEYPIIELVKGDWNDFGYKTNYRISIIESKSSFIKPLGWVKILNENTSSTELPVIFRNLPNSFCSLGTGLDYYKFLTELKKENCKAILNSLNDVAFDKQVFYKFEDKDGFKSSLFRGWNTNYISEIQTIINKHLLY